MKLERRDLIWVLPSAIAAGFFGWLGWRTIYIQFLKTGVSQPVWKDGPRVRVAEVGELKRPWAFKYFEYPVQMGSSERRLHAVALRLPQPVLGGLELEGAHFLALSRICTHQGCTLNFVDNPELGAIAYNFRTDHPFLGCPCHFGAFDPLQSGRAVYGPPRFPLPRLRLEAEAGVIYATGHETPLRPIEQG